MCGIVGYLRKALITTGMLLSVLLLGSIAVSSQTDKKLSYGLLFDNSGSMRLLLSRQQEIARLIVKKVDGSKFSMFGFVPPPTGSEIGRVAAGIECSTDLVAIEKQIDDIYIVGGQTTLLDSIKASADRLSNPVKPECEKSPHERILVIISDGEERASGIKTAELITSIKTSGVKVYIVGLITNLSRDGGFTSKSPMKKARELLTTLATETSGRVVFPKKNESAESVVAKLFAENYSFPK